MLVRDISEADLQAVLRLNADSVHFLSPLDAPTLGELLQEADYKKAVLIEDELVAFILAFDRDADYDSPNYQWFKARYSSFLYIDRIVVSGAHRRQGLADAVYRDILEYAAAKGFEYLTCEIDIAPPNLGSIRFHEKHHFREVGTQWLYNGGKQVSLRERKVSREKH